MSAANLDLNIEQGSTFQRLLTFKDSTNTAVDLTGRTFQGKIRATIGSPVVASFTFQLLAQTTYPGQVYLILPSTASDQIVVKKQTTLPRIIIPFTYDIEMTLTDGTVERVMQGNVNLSPGVTL